MLGCVGKKYWRIAKISRKIDGAKNDSQYTLIWVLEPPPPTFFELLVCGKAKDEEEKIIGKI